MSAAAAGVARPGPVRRLAAAVAGLRALPGATWTYLLLTALVCVAAYNTLNNLIYIVAGLMIALLVVSAVLSRWSVRGLALARALPHHLFAGDPVDVTVSLQNTKRRIGAFALTLHDAIDGERTHEAFMLALPPGDTRMVRYTHTFPRRGRHTFAALRVRSAFPFGFFPREAVLAAPQEVVVYPHVDPVDEITLTNLVDLRRFMHVARGFGANLYGIREYRPGDDSRHICWKLSAKMGRLLLREYETEQSREVTLVFDNGLPAATPEATARFEAAVRLTASLAAALTNLHCTLRLITRAGRGYADRGQQHLYTILYELALIEPTVGPAHELPPLRLHDVNPHMAAAVLADPNATWVQAMRLPVVLAPGAAEPAAERTAA